MNQKRFTLLDNLRGLLIILVVLGHVLNRISVPNGRTVYYIIFSFHMPAFIFLSGLFFRKGKGGHWKKLLPPYLIFQLLNIAIKCWETGTLRPIQFTVPQHTLWYLLALMLWQMVTNTIELRGRDGLIALALSMAAGLLVGLDEGADNFLTLSRAVAFFPFFLAGAYLRENHWESFQNLQTGKRSLLLALPMVLTQGLLLLQRSSVRAWMFYCAEPYESSTGLLIRAMVYCNAAAVILGLLVLLPRRELPVVTYLGQNTLSVYLLHNPILRILAKLGILAALPGPKVLWVVLLTTALLLCGAKPVVTAFHRFFSFDWRGAKTSA